MKRVFDLLASSVGLLLLFPLFVVLAMWVKLDSPGAVFFRQVRVGRNGVLFRIFKFRTMTEAASRGPLVTAAQDRRITRSGATLRRFKLDELPQLLNVLVGDMSLVGPRPEVPEYVALYPSNVRAEVLSIRPGITDEAAIAFANESELLEFASDPHQQYVNEILPRKLRMYQHYVQTRTFIGDLRIILRTLNALRRI
jgi:lipopolysaccharide/colanic/teichoic acid biosynthesis glycosyltransferase